jgi:hypothetical protein
MEQPQAIVTLGLIAALVILCVFPVWRYGPGEALKFVVATFAFFSFIGGSVVTYFLAQKQVAAAQTQAAEYRLTAAKAEIALDNFVAAVASKPEDAKLFELKGDPRYKSAAKTVTDLEPTIQVSRMEVGKIANRNNRFVSAAALPSP